MKTTSKKEWRRPQEKNGKKWRQPQKINLFLIPLKSRGKPFLGLAQLSKILFKHLNRRRKNLKAESKQFNKEKRENQTVRKVCSESLLLAHWMMKGFFNDICWKRWENILYCQTCSSTWCIGTLQCKHRRYKSKSNTYVWSNQNNLKPS